MAGRRYLRLHRHRRRLGRLRARQPPLGRPDALGAPPRGRRPGPPSARAAAHADGQADAFGHLQLALRHRAGARARQPPHLLAARQGARRHLDDQRHDLCARQRRTTTTAGRRWATPAGPMPRCCPTSGSRRATSSGATTFTASDGPLTVCRARGKNPLFDRFVEAGRQAGLCRQRRLQRRRAGRLRPLRLHHPQRQALQHGEGVPPSRRCGGRT